MKETLALLLAGTLGGALGTIFFGGLWWTVNKGTSSRHPAMFFLASLLLRTSTTLAGFYLVAGGDWQRLLWCCLGFVMARPAVTWLTRLPPRDPLRSPPEVSDAP